MIKQGDRFTSKDLQQSIHELCGHDIRTYLDKRQSSAMVLIGDTAVAPRECTPNEYAQTCIQAFADIPSSALNLDQQLRDKGFKTTYKFAYKYNMAGLNPQQIVHDAYCLDWFNQIYNTTMPREKYAKEYFHAIDDAFRLSYYYAQFLWAFNRRVCGDISQQLNMPDVPQWEQIISAILGVGFQFHPLDVYEYSIEHTTPNLSHEQFNARYAEQSEFKDKMKTDFDIDTGCLVLSPQNREKLQKIVTRTDTPYCLQVLKNLICRQNLYKITR